MQRARSLERGLYCEPPAVDSALMRAIVRPAGFPDADATDLADFSAGRRGAFSRFLASFRGAC